MPDLEKQYQVLKTEMQKRSINIRYFLSSYFFVLSTFLDENTNSILSEREMQYEKQMKEYQLNIDQTTVEIEQVRNELIQIQEEKILKEEKTNQLINTLKHDYEKKCEQLQNQLTELNSQGSIIFSC